jgi:hypothetical protein
VPTHGLAQDKGRIMAQRPRSESVSGLIVYWRNNSREAASQYQELLEASGLRLGRIVPTTGPMSVIEATRA